MLGVRRSELLSALLMVVLLLSVLRGPSVRAGTRLTLLLAFAVASGLFGGAVAAGLGEPHLVTRTSL